MTLHQTLSPTCLLIIVDFAIVSLLGRIAALAIATDGVEWSVVLSVGHNRNAVRDFHSGGPREPCIRWSPDPPSKLVILMGQWRPTVK